VAKQKRTPRTPPVLTPDDDADVEPARGKPRPTKDDDEDDYFGDDPPKGPKRPAAPHRPASAGPAVVRPKRVSWSPSGRTGS
jgi:hypothetical protein